MDNQSIELINAHGPFDHGVWRFANQQSGELQFGENSLFQSRADRMASTIVSHLKQLYTADQLAEKSILDVGCYDGWILTQLSAQIKFKKCVGVEPRAKNIQKGRYARELCGIETECNFMQGGYEDLGALFPKESFDIVMFLGTIHHVSSPYNAIKLVSTKCAGLFILDSMVIPELINDRSDIEPFINTKDIVYRDRPDDWSMAAFKYESPYFDGSTSQYQLVSIPQESLLRMSLVASGFQVNDCLMTEKDYYPETSQKIRGVQEVMLSSTRVRDHDSVEFAWKEDAAAYESLYCHALLNSLTLKYLCNRFGSIDTTEFVGSLGWATLAVPAELMAALDATFANFGVKDNNRYKVLEKYRIFKDQIEILSTIPRAPEEKLLLELGKFALKNRQLELAENIFKRISHKVNSDWRSFYRACYLMWIIEDSKKNIEGVKHYKTLLYTSNALFPLDLNSHKFF